MQDLTVDCQLAGHKTIIRISGDVVPEQCRTLREALDVGYDLDPTGPVVVDLAGVRQMTGPGMVVLREAVLTARRAGRNTTVKNLDLSAVPVHGLVLERVLAGAGAAV